MVMKGERVMLFCSVGVEESEECKEAESFFLSFFLLKSVRSTSLTRYTCWVGGASRLYHLEPGLVESAQPCL